MQIQFSQKADPLTKNNAGIPERIRRVPVNNYLGSCFALGIKKSYQKLKEMGLVTITANKSPITRDWSLAHSFIGTWYVEVAKITKVLINMNIICKNRLFGFGFLGRIRPFIRAFVSFI